ncbi:MAG: sugar phosphate isomerase/epimerase family protein [Christensenellales bacterium]
MKRINLQLCSIKEETNKDFERALEKVAEMGYSGVEFAGFNDIPAGKMKEMLSNNGLDAPSAHVGLGLLNSELDSQIEYLNELGARYIICPSADIRNTESALEYAEKFSIIGEKCKAAGLTFGYHNHAHEFLPDNKKYPMDVLFENVDSRLVTMEPDLFWLAYAGLDPIEYITKNKARISILHLKQIENMTTKLNVDAQDGIIDFKRAMEICGTAEFVYEQEEFTGLPINSVRRSAKYFTW